MRKPLGMIHFEGVKIRNLQPMNPESGIRLRRMRISPDSRLRGDDGPWPADYELTKRGYNSRP